MKFKVALGRILYNLIGKNMPISDGKFNFGSKKIRAFCGRLILDHCGKNVNIEKGAHFSSAVSLGDNSGIGIHSEISPGVTIGNDVMMGPECMIYTTNHGMSRTDIPMWRQPSTEISPVVIGNDVWIGARVIILPGVHIGNGCVIGAGSVVTKNIPDYEVWGGNPAHFLKSRKKDD